MSTSVEAPRAAPRTGGRNGVSLEGAGFSYAPRTQGGSALAAIENVTLDVAPGEFVAFVGPSGCGKTTLLELVCGLLAPSRGTIAGDEAVLMPQRDLLLPWLSALDNAALALRIHGADRRQARLGALPLFETFGLHGFEAARPYELSGGMRQRVAFLRTLLSGKPVLCLDEPFGALDALTRAEMRDWLAAALAREPRTTLLVTHDVEEACVLADRVVVLSPRPAVVRGVVPVPMPRPRRATDPLVVAKRERTLELLAG